MEGDCVRMLSRPQHGWTDFSLEENCYSLSYVTNVPLDWLDRAILGLETLSPFVVSGFCEPGKMVCTVEFSECRIVFEDMKHRKQETACATVPVSMPEFCKRLHEDIASHIEDWVAWNSSFHMTKEDIQSRLDRLNKLIHVKSNCFI